MENGVLRSDSLNNNLVQDRGNRMQVIGADMEALYTSLEAVEVAECTHLCLEHCHRHGENATNHRSPKFVSSISLDKTPSVVGGRLDIFGSITDMISQWKGME